MKKKSLYFLLYILIIFAIPLNTAHGEDSLYTGTGFIINDQGHAITNHHVIEECQKLTVYLNNNPIQGKILFKDPLNDLAILKLDLQPRTYAKFRHAKNLLLGEKVLVAGYPLQGVLATDLNFTTGIISSLGGLNNNNKELQITAPVQPGNSGGPLMDASGNIIGVIVSKLDAITIMKSTKDIPQNVNFAIKGKITRSFLDVHGIPFELSKVNKKYEPQEIAAMARGYTIYIECKNSDEQ
jgi:S1-C subfamily serine protease